MNNKRRSVRMAVTSLSLLLLVSFGGCATLILLKEDPEKTHHVAVPIMPGEERPNAICAYMDDSGTKLLLKYSIRLDNNRDGEAWMSVDLAKLYKKIGRSKIMVGDLISNNPYCLGANSPFVDRDWFRENVANGPQAEGKDFLRSGRLIWADSEDKSVFSNRRKWDPTSLRPIEAYTITEESPVRVDTPRVLGSLDKENHELWLTVSLPEDMGGGIGLIHFELLDREWLKGSAKAAVPLTVATDVALLPLYVPLYLGALTYIGVNGGK